MFVYDVLAKERRSVVIFGAGFVGAYIAQRCVAEGVSVAAFCDNVLGRDGGMVHGLPVRTLSALVEEYGEDIVFLISVRDIDTVVQQIAAAGAFSWHPVTLLYDLADIPAALPFMERQKLEAAYYVHKHYCDSEHLTLNTLDFVITERCSLRCRECSNLMQFYEKPQNFSLSALKQQITRLLSVYDEVYELRLLGGEPFVHPEMKEIIGFLNGENAIKRLCIYTNATILPGDDIFAVMAKGGKTWFSVSDYHELSRNLAPMTDKLETFGIGYELKPVDYWTRCASFEKHNRTPLENKRIFYECCAKDLLTLLNGRLYPCPFIANAMNLQGIPAAQCDYVDLMADKDPEELRKELRAKLKNRSCYVSCDYCIGRPAVAFVREEDKIAPHEQAKTILTYQRMEVKADG